MEIKAKGKKGENTRARIVREAIRIFAKAGFEAGSFQEIADSCGLSQAAAFYHFKNKDDLIEEVIQVVVASNHAEVASLIDISDNGFERILKHFRGNVRWGLRNPDEGQLLLLLYYLGCFNGRFSAIYTNLMKRARLRIQEHLLAGEREGIFKLRGNAVLLSELLHDALVGCMVNSFSTTHKRSQVEPVLVAYEEKWKMLFQCLLDYEAPPEAESA